MERNREKRHVLKALLQEAFENQLRVTLIRSADLRYSRMRGSGKTPVRTEQARWNRVNLRPLHCHSGSAGDVFARISRAFQICLYAAVEV